MFNTIYVRFCIALVLLPLPVWAEASPADTVIFTKKISALEELVILRGPSTDAGAFQILFPAQTVPKTTTIYAVRFELRTNGAGSIVLCTLMKRGWESAEYNGFEVLDVLMQPHAIIIATAEGVDIGLLRFDLETGALASVFKSRAAWFDVPQASHLSAQTTSVALSVGEDRETVIAVVSDSPGKNIDLPEKAYRTRFEQVPNKWEFSLASIDPAEPRTGDRERLLPKKSPPHVVPAQAKLVSDLSQWGADLTIERQASDNCLIGLDVSRSMFTDGMAKQLGSSGTLRVLNLAHTRITDSGLAGVSGLSQLRTLDLSSTRICGPGLANLRKLAALQELDLSYTRMNGCGLKYLRGLKNLTHLYLTRMKLEAADLGSIDQLTNLRVLDLAETGTADDALQYIVGLVSLETLNLSKTEITDSGLAHLASLSRLRKLSVSYTAIDDIGIQTLMSLRNLDTLDLTGTSVSDSALPRLAGLISLKTLKLNGTRISSDGVRRLKQEMPNCKIDDP